MGRTTSGGVAKYVAILGKESKACPLGLVRVVARTSPKLKRRMGIPIATSSFDRWELYLTGPVLLTRDQETCAMQHDFILLDRSGSMSSKWVETIGAVNGYVKKLADDKVDTGVTLAVFDSHTNPCDFDIVRDRIVPSTWNPVDAGVIEPRGYTPLNDAIGKIVALANQGSNGAQYDKLALYIVTDGGENASQELDHAKAKQLLDDCRAKGWQVIFLGADFDNLAQATTLGSKVAQTVRMAPGNMGDTMTMSAAKRGLYGSGAAASMDYSDEERKRAASPKA